MIEGWKQLKLSDSKVDSLLTSPNVRLLKEYRNGVFHFQKNYVDDRFVGFMRAKNSADWVRNVHSEFGNIFSLEKSQFEPVSRAGVDPQLDNFSPWPPNAVRQ